MFRFRYTKLLSVTVKHSYYADRISHDIEFTALPSTIAALESLGLCYRNDDGRLLVYQQLDDQDIPVQPIDVVTDLFFVLRVKTDLLNITQSFAQGNYWFSNLSEQGVYQSTLSHNPVVQADDALPELSAQRKVLNFLPGAVASIDIQRINPGTGWQNLFSSDIDPAAGSLEIKVLKPGLVRVLTHLKSGSTTQTKYVMSDELAASTNPWSLLHLQLKPGVQPIDYDIELKSRASLWRYFLVEPENRNGGVLTAGDLSLKYSAVAPSRYPANMLLALQDPLHYPTGVKQSVDAIKSAGRVREVYCFESAANLEVLDGVPPEIMIMNGVKNLASKISVPGRNMNHSTIIYKL